MHSYVFGFLFLRSSDDPYDRILFLKFEYFAVCNFCCNFCVFVKFLCLCFQGSSNLLPGSWSSNSSIVSHGPSPTPTRTKENKDNILIFTGPRCLWGPVYGSRCLYVCTYDRFVKLCWCDSGWWWYQLNTIDDANLKRSLAIRYQCHICKSH